jgi:hypothetical protein
VRLVSRQVCELLWVLEERASHALMVEVLRRVLTALLPPKPVAGSCGGLVRGIVVA